MTKQTRRRFSPEYKEQSVARLSEPGATHSRVARAALFEYIEIFYNRQRRHSSIG